MKRSNLRRVLRLENLQLRQLLAADCIEISNSLELHPGEDIPLVSVASMSTQSSDAGSTRATARDFGTIERGITVDGRLSWNDSRDVFRFDIEHPGDVTLTLNKLSRNADLFLANERGSIMGLSSQNGTRAESLSGSLDAGVYYVGVDSRAFWGTSYELELKLALDIPKPLPRVSDPISPLVDVPYFGGQADWNLNVINAPESWAVGYAGQGVTVAVIDTGIDLDHPDLVGNLFRNQGEIPSNGIDDDGNGLVDDVRGYDFADRDADPNDVNGHGTHVAGSIAAALNGFGSTGVAPEATILPVRVLDNSGSGRTGDVARGIRYAADLGADIINLSLGGGYSRAIDAAIDYAAELGVFIVAAAGNEAAAVPSYPAQLSVTHENVISVGAVDFQSWLARFSNQVGRSGAVQIDAPGVGVVSTYAGGRYGSLSGTSMATPQVAGVAALALSANPDLTPQQLRDLLTAGVTDVASGSDSVGLVNAATTVAWAAAGWPMTEDMRNHQSRSRGGDAQIFLASNAPGLPPITTTNSFDPNERTNSWDEISRADHRMTRNVVQDSSKSTAREGTARRLTSADARLVDLALDDIFSRDAWQRDGMDDLAGMDSASGIAEIMPSMVAATVPIPGINS